jgi:hypothetical protein
VAVRVGVLVVVVIQRNRYETVERCKIVQCDTITYRFDVSDRREMKDSMNGEGGKRADAVVVVVDCVTTRIVRPGFLWLLRGLYVVRQ